MLNKDELEFLNVHNIPLEKVFDASGMKREEYHVEMKKNGYVVAMNTTPCKVAGHKIRNRSGKCIQCNPAAIAFENRYEKRMFVYIAQPNSGNLTKIGISDNLIDRVRQLNLHKLGGFTTWEVRYSVRCENAGRVEDDVRKLLQPFNLPTKYQSKSGEVSVEVYKCSFDQALHALNRIMDDPPTPVASSPSKIVSSKLESVESFAKSLGMPVNLLIDKLLEAGINIVSPTSTITCLDKTNFLKYLQSRYKW